MKVEPRLRRGGAPRRKRECCHFSVAVWLSEYDDLETLCNLGGQDGKKALHKSQNDACAASVGECRSVGRFTMEATNRVCVPSPKSNPGRKPRAGGEALGTEAGQFLGVSVNLPSDGPTGLVATSSRAYWCRASRSLPSASIPDALLTPFQDLLLRAR